ncbi:hypothetical protein [Streptomyces violaceolatus]|uniref:hypothetical protein n=1 Tax=Streptomyces violaceolatus TaxID=67378 RepID=UPI0031E237E8
MGLVQVGAEGFGTVPALAPGGLGQAVFLLGLEGFVLLGADVEVVAVGGFADERTRLSAVAAHRREEVER